MGINNTTLIDWKVKTFQELELNELYKIIQLREEVFILEQKCIYTDLDFADQDCTHIMGFINEEMVAYSRIFAPDASINKSASFGRVLVAKKARGINIGRLLITQLLETIEQLYQTNHVEISAQSYLVKFYQEFGFQTYGEGYLDAGIPHISMKK